MVNETTSPSEPTILEPDFKWYMITTLAGKEDLVIESLENKIESEKLNNIFHEFKVAYVPHLTPRGLKKRRNLFPGYLFINMRMTNEAWFIVRNTLFVTGLVGSSGHRTKPTPVSILEMNRISNQIKVAEERFKAHEDAKNDGPFQVGDLVIVTNGVLKDEKGPVLEIFSDRKIALIELIQFERKVATEINFDDLDLVNNSDK